MVLGIAFLALVLSVGLAFATYATVRLALLDQIETTATEQVTLDGRLVRDALETSDVDVAQMLRSLRPAEQSRPLLRHEGEWFTVSLAVEPGDLATELQETVLGGTAARQRYRLSDDPVLALGIPLAQPGDAYFEVFSLERVEETLDTLRQALLVFATATTLAGAGLGWVLSRRVLRPLHHVTNAAEDIARGDLDRRIDEDVDADLVKLSSSFNHMADSLTRRIEREERFASDVSHELRSPLTTLVNSVGVLERRRHELSPSGAAALDLLAAEVHRFTRMVTDLLEISKTDAGLARNDPEEVRIAELVDHALEGALQRSVPVAADDDALEAVVRVDKRRLERVVSNLVDNAERHGDGVTCVWIRRTAGEVRIVVDDAGPGIPPDERDRVFERFARGTRSRRRTSDEGIGLGLSIVAENVRLQGGRTWIEDRPGGGARVVVALPEVER